LSRRCDVDHAAVDRADLEDIVPYGDLSADLAVDLSLYVFCRDRLDHSYLLFPG